MILHFFFSHYFIFLVPCASSVPYWFQLAPNNTKKMRQNKNILTTNVIVRSYNEIRTCNEFPERISWPLKFFILQHILSLSFSTFQLHSCRCLSVSTESHRECVFFVFNCLIFEHRAIFTLTFGEQSMMMMSIECAESKLIRSYGIAWAVLLIWCRNGIKLMQIN